MISDHIVIIAPFCSFSILTRDSRHVFLANIYHDLGYSVTLYTSQYDHYSKRYVKLETSQYPFKVIQIPELPYKSNISISRLVSHLILQFFTACILSVHLINNPTKVRLLIVTYPLAPLCLFSLLLSRLCNISCIVDVQDKWPEIFLPLIARKVHFSLIKSLSIRSLLLYSRFLRVSIVRLASHVLSVSQSYLDYFLESSSSISSSSSVLYLGSDLTPNIPYPNQICSKPNTGFLSFLIFGSTGYSYDLQFVIEVFDKFLCDYNQNLNLTIIGDGPQSSFLKLMSNSRPYLEVYDSVPFYQLFPMIQKSNFLINPLALNATQSVSNRLCDYIVSSKPIITSMWPNELNSTNAHYILYDPASSDSLLQILLDICSSATSVATDVSGYDVRLMNRSLSYQDFAVWSLTAL